MQLNVKCKLLRYDSCASL